MIELKRHSNKINLLLDEFDRWYIEYINSLDFNSFYKRESKLGDLLIDKMSQDVVKKFVTAIASESLRFAKDILGYRPELTLPKGYAQGIKVVIESEFNYWFTNFSFNEKVLNRTPKDKKILESHWIISMPSMKEKVVNGQTVDKVITGIDTWYSPLWSKLHSNLRSRLKQYSTILATDVINE